VFCQAFIGDYIDIDAVGSRVAAIWTDNSVVSDPLTPAECADYITRSTDPAIQADLNDGSLDQEAFVHVIHKEPSRLTRGRARRRGPFAISMGGSPNRPCSGRTPR
jgi:hypothetical protein